MKKIIAILAALTLLLFCGVSCAETADEVFAKLPDDFAVAFSSAMEFVINGTEAVLHPDGTLTEDELQELTAELLLYKDCGKFGYLITDLDGDGNDELMIGTQTPEDGYFGKMILRLYSCRTLEDGDCDLVTVFESAERDRYYYAGGNRFFEEGSSGADDSFATTWAYENGELKDLGVVTDPADFVQAELWDAYPISED